MNWEALGAIGEMIGALAVVVTLAYLAVQVRASTAESEAEDFSRVAAQLSEVRGRFMEHAEVWMKGNAGEALSAPECFVFGELVAVKNSHHFFSFMRSTVREAGLEGVHVSEMARFLHQYPMAYPTWRSQQESMSLAQLRTGVTPDPGWARAVIEAVAVLEGVEKTAEV